MVFSYQKKDKYFNYLKKRYVSLLVPYYLLCLLSLFVYYVNNSSLPSFDFNSLFKWLTMRQSNTMMPFPVGQIWWLQTLLILSFWAPLIVWFEGKNPFLNLLIIILGLCLSSVPLLQKGCLHINFIGFYVYDALFYTIFFTLGFLYAKRKEFFSTSIVATIMGGCLSGCLLLIHGLNLNVTYKIHCFPPDLYYALGSLFAVGILILIKKPFMQIIRKYLILSIIMDFFYKHTFSIFFLHTFSIYLCEQYFYFVLPVEKNMIHGLIKLQMVLIITCVLSLPYTNLSRLIIRFIMK
jgi:hypothetical protein